MSLISPFQQYITTYNNFGFCNENNLFYQKTHPLKIFVVHHKNFLSDSWSSLCYCLHHQLDFYTQTIITDDRLSIFFLLDQHIFSFQGIGCPASYNSKSRHFITSIIIIRQKRHYHTTTKKKSKDQIYKLLTSTIHNNKEEKKNISLFYLSFYYYIFSL